MRFFSPAKTSVLDPVVSHFGYDLPCNLAEQVKTYNTGALINRTIPYGNALIHRGFYPNQPNPIQSYINGVAPVKLNYDAPGNITTRTTNTLTNAYDIVPNRIQKNQQTAPNLARQKANTKDEDPTGLLNEGMRYRDLETGSFITRDPLGFVDGPNMYSYVRQNPWTAFDPEGLNEVVVSGGVCVEPKTDPEHHDTDGDHFLTAAKLEISARKEKVKQGEQVEWLVDRGTYDARGKLEKKDYLKQIEGMAKDMGAVLRWFDGKDELTDALNHGTDGKDRSGSGLISRFTYFGHGRPGALMTKYDGSADFEADDLAGGRLNRRAFASGASATSFGCNSASPQYNEHESQTPNGQPSFRDAWQNATGVPMAGLIGKSDYSPLNRGSTARVMTDLFCFPLTDFSGPRPPQCGNQNWGPNRGQPSYWVPKQ